MRLDDVQRGEGSKTTITEGTGEEACLIFHEGIAYPLCVLGGGDVGGMCEEYLWQVSGLLVNMVMVNMVVQYIQTSPENPQETTPHTHTSQNNMSTLQSTYCCDVEEGSRYWHRCGG